YATRRSRSDYASNSLARQTGRTFRAASADSCRRPPELRNLLVGCAQPLSRRKCEFRTAPTASDPGVISIRNDFHLVPAACEVTTERAHSSSCGVSFGRYAFASRTHDSLRLEQWRDDLQPVGSFMMRTHPDTFLPQQGERSLAYVRDGKAIFTHHDLARCRGAEAIYAKHITVIADVAMPALRGTRLHRKSRTD